MQNCTLKISSKFTNKERTFYFKHLYFIGERAQKEDVRLPKSAVPNLFVLTYPLIVFTSKYCSNSNWT